MNSEFLKTINEEISLTEKEVRQFSPLVLAYIGDAVYEVFIRTLLVSKGNTPVHKLHKQSTNYVKSKSQCKIIKRIEDKLTFDEKEIVRRGRNAKAGTIPKNADVIEYKYATGFEALIGFLYLNKGYDRLMEILNMCLEENENEKG